MPASPASLLVRLSATSPARETHLWAKRVMLEATCHTSRRMWVCSVAPVFCLVASATKEGPTFGVPFCYQGQLGKWWEDKRNEPKSWLIGGIPVKSTYVSPQHVPLMPQTIYPIYGSCSQTADIASQKIRGVQDI